MVFKLQRRRNWSPSGLNKLLRESQHPILSIDPDREYIITPNSVKRNYEQLEVTTKNGFRLSSWIYDANPENGKDSIIILAYPDAGNKSYSVYHSMILAIPGDTVIIID